jgi:exosome complex RNA-binding protein Csl4
VKPSVTPSYKEYAHPRKGELVNAIVKRAEGQDVIVDDLGKDGSTFARSASNLSLETVHDR